LQGIESKIVFLENKIETLIRIINEFALAEPKEM